MGKGVQRPSSSTRDRSRSRDRRRDRSRSRDRGKDAKTAKTESSKRNGHDSDGRLANNKEIRKASSKEVRKDAGKDSHKDDGTKDNHKDKRGDTHRDSQRESQKEKHKGSRRNEKEIQKESRKHDQRLAQKGSRKEGQKDSSKDCHKDSIKGLDKDHQKKTASKASNKRIHTVASSLAGEDHSEEPEKDMKPNKKKTNKVSNQDERTILEKTCKVPCNKHGSDEESDSEEEDGHSIVGEPQTDLATAESHNDEPPGNKATEPIDDILEETMSDPPKHRHGESHKAQREALTSMPKASRVGGARAPRSRIATIIESESIGVSSGSSSSSSSSRFSSRSQSNSMSASGGPKCDKARSKKSKAEKRRKSQSGLDRRARRREEAGVRPASGFSAPLDRAPPGITGALGGSMQSGTGSTAEASPTRAADKPVTYGPAPQPGSSTGTVALLPEKVRGLLDNRDMLAQDVLRLKQAFEVSLPLNADKRTETEEGKETVLRMNPRLHEHLLHPDNETRLLARTGLSSATLNEDGYVVLRAHSRKGLMKALGQLRRVAYHCQWGCSKTKVAALLAEKPARPVNTMVVRLAATSSRLQSHEARLTNKVRKLRVGTQANACQLVVEGIPGLSRKHCTITFEPEKGACYVQDLSTNGTFLNSKRLPRPPYKNPQDARVRLFHGDELFFRLRSDESEELGYVVNLLELS